MAEPVRPVRHAPHPDTPRDTHNPIDVDPETCISCVICDYDMRGKVTGPSTDGTARLTDSTESEHIAAQIKRKYGLAYTAIGLLEKLRRRESNGSVGI